MKRVTNVTKVNQHIFILVTLAFKGILVGCAQEKSSINGMVCTLSTQQTKDCSSTPVLQHGMLKTDSNGEFELKGHYDACFHVEDVIIKGKYTHLTTGKTLTLELLATNIKGSKDAPEDFPRTVGFMKLDNKTLNGTFDDIWATIRAQNTNSERKAPISLNCKKM